MKSLVVLVLLLIARPAAADRDLAIVGPVVEGNVSAKTQEQAKQALAGAGLGTLSEKVIDTTCAADPACLAKAGSGALAVVSVTLAAKGSVAFVFVDVAAKELIAKRDVTIAGSKLAKELGPALVKFVDEGRTERSKELYAEGSKHYSLGEFARALELYKRAYRIKQLPAFLFNIGQCHRKLGQHKDAIAMYQSYLVGVPNAENRKLVESLIEESKAALATEQASADRRAADAARLESERIAAEKKKFEQAAAAAQAQADAEAAKRNAEIARIEAERDREKLYDKHPARKWAILGGSIGAAAAIGGGVFAMRARSAQSAFDDAGCGDRDQVLDGPALAQCESDRDRGASSARLGTVLLASGGTILAAGLVVFVLDPGNLDRPESARVGVVLAPSSAKLVLRW